MTAERDTDRRLRAWVAEGADHAPERFVWAALDDTEHVAQRRPWRIAVDGLWGRRGRLGLAVGAVAVVVAVVAVAVRLADAPPDVGSPPRNLTVADLPTIVLWEGTKPVGWSLDNLVSNPTAVRDVPIRSLSGDALASLPDPTGYIGGRYVDFSDRDGAFMSWATVYERSADAVAAQAFYEGELSSSDGWGFGAGTPIRLGDGGFVYEGKTTRLIGPPGDPVQGRVYLWRHGNVLLALGAWFIYDPPELDELAAGMDQRASDLAQRRE